MTRKRSLALLGLAGLFLVAFLVTYARAFRNESCLFDYTGSLYRSYRIFLGQIPYRDFYCPITPGTFFTQAAIWKLFGFSLIWTRSYLAFCNGVLSLIAFLLARRAKLSIFQSVLVFILAMTWSPYGFMGIPWYDSDAAAIALLTGLSQLYLLGRDSAPWRFLVPGALAGLCILFKQNIGMGCEILAVLWLLFMPGEKKRWLKLLMHGLGTCAVLGIFVLFFHHHDAWGKLVEWTFVRAKEGKLVVGLHTFLAAPLLSLFGPINHFFRVIVLLHMAGAAALIRQFFVVKDPIVRRDTIRWGFFLVFAWGVTYAELLSNAAIGYPSHMIFLWLPLLILLRYVHFPGKPILAGLFILGMVAQSLRISFYQHKVVPNAAVTNYALQSPRMQGVYFTEVQGKNFDAVVEALKKRMAAEENVWIYPEPGIAYLSLDRLSPTPQTEYTFRPAMRAEDQAEIIQNLKGKNVRWAILWLWPDTPGLMIFPELNEYMATRFEIVEKTPVYLLLHRPHDDFAASKNSQGEVMRLIREHVTARQSK